MVYCSATAFVDNIITMFYILVYLTLKVAKRTYDLPINHKDFTSICLRTQFN